MSTIEREIKILSHVNEIEFILDDMGIKSKKEVQSVLSVRIGRESCKLKIKEDGTGEKCYVFCRKSSTKQFPDVINKNFSNKIEEEKSISEEEFHIIQNFFREVFKNYNMMDYVIQKKRYEPFHGYNIDICQILNSNDKSKYYTERFIEIEENFSDVENIITIEQLMNIIIPNRTDIFAVNAGIRNLNKMYKKTSMIQSNK